MSECKVISVANQKGGVGKTTTTVNLGVGLAKNGKRVLLIDGDPQGDLTYCLGFDVNNLDYTLANLMTGYIEDREIDTEEVILSHEEGVDVIPSNIDLSALELMLVTTMNREYIMSRIIEPLKKQYDYIIIDCPPSLSMLTINEFAASDSVIIPVQAQALPARNMTLLLQTVGRVRKHINPKLKVDGIVITLVDTGTNLAKETAETLQKDFGAKLNIYKTSIPRAIKAAEVAKEGISLYSYEPKNATAIAYNKLTKEVMHNGAEKKKERLQIAER